mgnify:CR=1 FL=1
MKKFDPTPQKVSAEYQAGVQFNQGIQLYDCVNVNENFFIGKQWEGVHSNGLPTPVFNFLKGCHTVFISCQCHNAAHCKKDTHKQCRNDQECCDPCIKYLFSSLSSVSFPYAGALLLIHVIFCP